MFGSKQSGIHAYSNVSQETGTVDSSPLKLTVKLYDGAITACIHAQKAMQQGDIAKKGESLTKAVSIIDNGLRASLNKRAGGQIAASLDQLYQYMSRSLMQASLHMDVKKVQEIQQLLTNLKNAWETLEKNGVNKVAQANTAMDTLVTQQGQGNAFNRLAMAGV